MIYVTTRQKAKEKQISWLDLIGDDEISVSDLVTTGSAGTVTRTLNEATPELLRKINVDEMINMLKRFNNCHENLFKANRCNLYRHFEIAKRTGGGTRPIDAPCTELKLALSELAMILSDKFGVLYHTAAFAYIPNRCTTQLARKHQVNNSNWFYKTDVSGFFPSTTLDFTMKMLKMIFPLSEICKVDEGYKELRKAISLGFLNGVLPQGSPLSPMLTNVICIPIDHHLFNLFAHKRMVYTRYADDLHISCQQKIDPKKITEWIENAFKAFNAPWILKPEKTHYGSRKGKNFMLGVCVNADNNITTGWRTKQLFKAQTANLIMDYKHGKCWPIDEIRQYSGLLSYYKMVEKDYFEELVNRYNDKFHVNVKSILKECMSI